MEDPVTKSKYEYHSVRDTRRQPVHFRRLNPASKLPDPELTLEVASFHFIAREQVFQLFRLLGALKGVEGGEYTSKKDKTKRLWTFLVVFRRVDDLLKAFNTSAFQALVKPVVPPLTTEAAFGELDDQELRARQSQNEGFITVRGKDGSLKRNQAALNQQLKKADAKMRKKIAKDRENQGLVRAVAGLGPKNKGRRFQQM